MILIRLFLLLHDFSFDALDYVLNTTPSNNPMSLSNMLNSTPMESGRGSNSSPGNGNLPPTDNVAGSGVEQNLSMAKVRAKLILQNEELSTRTIYSPGFSEAATLSTAEKDLLATTIANDPNSRPYAVLTSRNADHDQVSRVIKLPDNYIGMPRNFSHANIAKPTGAFIDFLSKYL